MQEQGPVCNTRPLSMKVLKSLVHVSAKHIPTNASLNALVYDSWVPLIIYLSDQTSSNSTI